MGRYLVALVPRCRHCRPPTCSSGQAVGRDQFRQSSPLPYDGVSEAEWMPWTSPDLFRGHGMTTGEMARQQRALGGPIPTPPQPLPRPTAPRRRARVRPPLAVLWRVSALPQRARCLLPPAAEHRAGHGARSLRGVRGDLGAPRDPAALGHAARARGPGRAARGGAARRRHRASAARGGGRDPRSRTDRSRHPPLGAPLRRPARDRV